MQKPSSDQALRDLEGAWLSAETSADVAVLDAIATEDFTLVGPAGFVLHKQQWLDRYRHGDLVTQSLSFEDAVTRMYGDAAVTIGSHVQRAEYQGHPASGEFRATHIAIRDGARWLLAGQHLSPIGGPPPFGQRPPEGRTHAAQNTGQTP